MSIVLSGSLILTGSISASGNLTTLGTITAQTLVVQTITSSIVNLTGSNIFGSRLTDTQTFTGSVVMTGSLTVNTTGTEFQVTNAGIVMGNLLTDNHSVTGSLRITGSIIQSGANTTSSFTGIVGIGTTTPDSQLVINGSSNSRLNMRAGDTRYGTLYADAGVFALASITSIPLVFGTNDVEKMRITSAGNVGIGITSPSSILHISASSSTITGKVILQSPSSDSGILQIGSSYGEASMMFIPGVTAFGTSSPTRTSSFGNAALWGLGPGTYTSDPTKFGIANVGFGANVLTVSSSGALGIGTTTPTTRLFVLGSGTYNTATTEILTSDATIFSSEMSNDAYNSILQLVSVRQSLTTGASSNGFLGFSTIDDSNGEGIRDAGRIAIVNETAASRNSATALGFWTNSGGTKTTAATEKLRIASSGAATFSSTVRATSTGVDGTYADAFIAQYSSNNSETNAIQTAVSSVAANSGFRFQVSNGGGSSARTSMMDITRSGVKFQNGSSYLNYYEEGSWTPSLTSGTISYTTRSGTYTRIGNYVFVRWGFLIGSISGQGSGNVQISGLPFTSVSWGSYQEPNISVSTGGLVTSGNAAAARMFVGGGGTSLFGRIANNSDTSWLFNDLQAGSWIIGEIFYNV